MTRKSETDREFLARLESSLARDPLSDDMPVEEVRDQLRDEGGDPEGIAARGAEIAALLLTRQRLSWMDTARTKREARAKRLGGMKRLPRSPRTEELGKIQSARGDPKLSGTVEMAFRKRKPDDLSDDEVHDLLEEIEALRLISEDDKEGGGEEGT